MINLRPYQQRAIDMLADSFRRSRKAPVLVAPTGSGKTRLAAAICERAAEKGNHVLFVAPRRGLVFQTADSFRELGIDAGVIMSGEEYDPRHMVDVASIDTLVSRLAKDHATNALMSAKKSTIIPYGGCAEELGEDSKGHDNGDIHTDQGKCRRARADISQAANLGA